MSTLSTYLPNGFRSERLGGIVPAQRSKASLVRFVSCELYERGGSGRGAAVALHLNRRLLHLIRGLISS